MARERGVPEYRRLRGASEAFAARRACGGETAPAHEHVFAVALHDGRLATCDRLDDGDGGAARSVGVERIYSRAPDVALDVLDNAGIDSLALLVLERGASLLLADHDAWNHVAVYLKFVAAYSRALRHRKLQLALEHAAVWVGERDGRLHHAVERVGRNGLRRRCDCDRLFVRVQVLRDEDGDGARHDRLRRVNDGLCAHRKRGKRGEKHDGIFHSAAIISKIRVRRL